MRPVYTYFIQAITGGPIKIGKAMNPRMRLRDLQIGSPIELQIVGVLNGDNEREWHNAYKCIRLHGEWFSNEPGLVDDINEFCDGGCAIEDDFNGLEDAHLMRIESLRKYVFTHKDNIKPSVIRRWAHLDKVCSPGYVPPPPQLTLFTHQDEACLA